MSIITYNDVDEAIKIANDAEYGLASYVYGKDKDTLHKVARLIEAGTVVINEDGRKPDLPFGGYKSSGLGREWGDYGIEEILEVKSVAGYYKAYVNKRNLKFLSYKSSLMDNQTI